MGYATVQNLPRRVHTYEHAKQLHDGIKPIRGSDPQLRPLGARRDASQYSVRMNGDEVEFVCYKTPIITYQPDGTIKVKSDGWSSITTHQMLSWVLALNINGAKGGGKTVITTHDNHKYLIDSVTTIKFRLEGDNLVTVDAEKPMGYRINRKQMIEVRKQYTEFIKYMKGFISLRVHEESRQQYGRTYRFNELSYTVGEAVDAMGREFKVPNANLSHKGYYLCNMNWFMIDRLPSEVRYRNTYNYKPDDIVEHYNKHTPEFLSLCRNDQDEDMKHANYHKAMMVIVSTEGLYGNGFISANDDDLTNVRTIKDPNFLERFEGIIKRWHRHEVLDYVEMKAGETPIAQYDSWMVNK